MKLLSFLISYAPTPGYKLFWLKLLVTLFNPMVYFGPPKSDFISYEPGPGVGSITWAFGCLFPVEVPSRLNFWLIVNLGPSPITDLYL